MNQKLNIFVTITGMVTLIATASAFAAPFEAAPETGTDTISRPSEGLDFKVAAPVVGEANLPALRANVRSLLPDSLKSDATINAILVNGLSSTNKDDVSAAQQILSVLASNDAAARGSVAQKLREGISLTQIAGTVGSGSATTTSSTSASACSPEQSISQFTSGMNADEASTARATISEAAQEAGHNVFSEGECGKGLSTYSLDARRVYLQMLSSAVQAHSYTKATFAQIYAKLKGVSINRATAVINKFSSTGNDGCGILNPAG